MIFLACLNISIYTKIKALIYILNNPKCLCQMLGHNDPSEQLQYAVASVLWISIGGMNLYEMFCWCWWRRCLTHRPKISFRCSIGSFSFSSVHPLIQRPLNPTGCEGCRAISPLHNVSSICISLLYIYNITCILNWIRAALHLIWISRLVEDYLNFHAFILKARKLISGLLHIRSGELEAPEPGQRRRKLIWWVVHPPLPLRKKELSCEGEEEEEEETSRFPGPHTPSCVFLFNIHWD